MSRTKRFQHTPESVTLARRFALEVLKGASAEACDAVALMISELASNCIRHTESGFELTIARSASEIRVEARDGGSGKPTMRTPAPTDPNGRGLQIIDMLSSSWGVEPAPGGGKTVWFALASQVPAQV